MKDVVVYGATGYTGRLVCDELKQRGADFCVAGRDRAKLAALAASLGGVPIEVAALGDPAALERMVESARVVLDCAGPFARFGRPVQEAALEAGRHFLDITGEEAYMRETFTRDADARSRGIALVNAVGFDVVPTDAAAVLAAEAVGSPVTRVRIAFTFDARPTQGTLRSILHRTDGGGLAFIDGAYVQEPVASEQWEAPFFAPVGPRRCVSVPWGDLATAPRSTGAREVRTFVAAHPLALRAFGAVTRPPLVRGLLEKLVDLLPEGPSGDVRGRTQFAVYAEADGARGCASAWVQGGDPYDFTAAAAARCAIAAARPDFTARGALTPAQAFGARTLLDQMADRGVRWGMMAPA